MILETNQAVFLAEVFGVLAMPGPTNSLLFVSGATRDEAIERSVKALQGFTIEGIKTNIPLHLRIVQDAAYRAGTLDTHVLEHHAKA